MRRVAVGQATKSVIKNLILSRFWQAMLPVEFVKVRVRSNPPEILAHRQIQLY